MKTSIPIKDEDIWEEKVKIEKEFLVTERLIDVKKKKEDKMDFIRLETKRLHSETQKWLDPMVSSSGTNNQSVLQTGKWTDIMLLNKTGI